MTAFLSFIGVCLAVPGVRIVVEDIIIRLITSGSLFSSSADPVYREKALGLMSQLGAAQTEEAKRAILVQIQALRKPPTP